MCDKKETMLIESEGIIERVRYMMESMELNATAFATEAGITPSVISHMLNGRNLTLSPSDLSTDDKAKDTQNGLSSRTQTL